MRRRITPLVVVAAVLGMLTFVLGGIALSTSSTGWTVAALVTGILSVIAVAGMLILLLATVVRRFDEQSTRLSNSEKRVEALQNESSVQIEQLEASSARDHRKLEVTHDLSVRSREQLRIIRRRVPADFLGQLEAGVQDLDSRSLMPRRLAFESALQLGRDPASLIDQGEAQALYREYMARGELLPLRPLIENFDVLTGRSLTELRTLFQYFRRVGYWSLAADVAGHLGSVTGRDNDLMAVAKVRREIEVFSEPTLVSVDLPDADAYDPSGPIVHMVGRVLPDTQTGYTLRTQYTAMAQAARGLHPVIVGQSGITTEQAETLQSYEVDGIEYFVLPGRRRNEYLLDDWLRSNMVELAVLVRELRPSILHAQSDFFNALIVQVVADKYGIPTVYESRGFWEESWLSRVVAANGWDRDAEIRFAMYGRPQAYELRKHAEESARLLPDHVFTLAEVMREHILESGHGAIPDQRVTSVPNAVDPAAFPVQIRDTELAEIVGIPDGALTIGYISSIVEYEGIDTLLEAYRMLRLSSDAPSCLLLVGDGDHAAHLRRLVAEREIPDVIFTGRVPHEDILKYYGLIDLFVVPRKKSDVTDLVTPLKPFEAFATGRAVVLSDVDALREIAEQSGATALFRADDAEDLARVLRGLIEDAPRRAEMAVRAARWVRNHRTWLNNVGEYYRVYRELGYEGPVNPVIESELALHARGVNPGDVIDALAVLPLPPMTGWFSLQEMRQTAQDIMSVGWQYESFEPVPVATIEDWSRYGREHRSWGYNLHAWKFMEPLLREYDGTGESRWLHAAVDIALRWVAFHRSDPGPEDPMVWYDMALALRTSMLVALTLRVTRVTGLRDEAAILVEELCRHADALHEAKAFNPLNNHGFYAAASQLHLAKYAPDLPSAESTRIEGGRRLSTMATSQFAADGVHLEHSPDYHRMLLGSFESAIADGLIEDEGVRRRIERAAHVLGWMIQPDGKLVQFGDSPETRMVLKGATSIDPETLFLMKDGKEGRPPSAGLAVFREGGYAFVRSPIPQGPGDPGRSGYLAFSAAFHSRAHKHADDLNVVWYDRGQQILTDGGRYGYGELLPAGSPLRNRGFYYASEERQYFEGTMAHNTLMIDGVDQERRAREPYGSGIAECVERDGMFDLSARVHHSDYIHRRRLVYRPGEELLVKDSVFSQSPDEREGILWFNISGHFELESVGDGVTFVSHGVDGVRLHVEAQGRLIAPVRGQSSPMRGWRSRQDRTMEPTWSVGFAFPIAVRASVDTVLRLS